MTGTECCNALMVTTTHQTPSWHTCAKCGQPVTVTGETLRPPEQQPSKGTKRPGVPPVD